MKRVLTEKYKPNYRNIRDIDKDALSAKSTGISYGKYKAGILSIETPSQYEVLTTEYVRPKKRKSESKQKVIACIR